MKHWIGFALLAAASLAHAQGAASAPASAAKKELVHRLLVLQQPALDSMARNLIEQPARQMMAAADNALKTRVAPEQRKAVADQIQGLLHKYLDEAGPLVREHAAKIGQTSLGPLFEEKFSEDELRQLLAALELPVYKKFQQSLPELTNTFIPALVKDLGPSIEPKLKALDQGVASALGAPGPAASAPTGTKPGAAAASKPAK